MTVTIGSSNYDQADGTFTGGDSTIDLNGAFVLSSGTFTATSGTMTVSGAWTHTVGGTFTHNSGTVAFDGAAANRILDVNTSETFNHFQMKKTAGFDLDIADGDTVLVLGTTTFDSATGSIILAGGTLEMRGDITVESGSDCGLVAFLISGSNNQTMTLTGSEATCNGDITVNKSGGAVNLGSALTVDAANQDLIIQEGVFDLNGNNLTVNGSTGQLDVEDGGTLQLQGGETITANSGNPDLQSGSTVTYDGTGTHTIKDYAYHHLTFNGSGTFNLGANESTAGNTTITAGTFATAGYNMTVTGTFSNASTFRVQGNETLTLTTDTDSGTVEYVGDGDGSAETLTLRETGATDFYNLAINDANATKDTFNAGSALNVAGTFTVTSGTTTHGGSSVTATAITVNGGTFTGGSATIDINGPFALSSGTFKSTSGNLNVSGNFAHNSGTFTHNSGTVVLDGGDQTITGATTFNHLTKTVAAAQTLTFPSNATIVIAGTATLKGQSGNILSLRSSTDGTQASVDFQGADEFEYLDVKDNNNINLNNVVCVLGCTNSGNNSKWKFIADMTVTLSLSGSPVTITAGQTSVNISVTIVDDDEDENDETILIDMGTPTAASQGTNIRHTMTITDNDTAAILLTHSASATSVTEGGITDTYTVQLNTKPTQNVSININPDAQTTTDLAILTFTSGNWNTAQTITATAVDDKIDEDNHSSKIAHTATSSDSKYEALAVDLTATLVDNDTAGVSLTEINGAIEEGGSGQYEIVLTTQPVNDVTIAISPDKQSTVATSLATFTATNWQTAQAVSVTISDDKVAEGNHQSTVAHTMNSSDSKYQGLTVNSVIVTITDNDTAGVNMLNLDEGVAITQDGVVNRISVILTSEPVSDVVVTLGSGDGLAFDPASLTFSASHWNTEQIAEAYLAAEATVSGESASITATVQSSDTGYNSITVTSLSVKLSTESGEIDTNSANCSDDKAFENSEYTLGKTCDGLSDFSGEFLWTQVSGQTVVLNSANSLYATFTVPENNVTALVFEIVALQDDIEVFSDSMKISAIKRNITLKKAKEITEFSGDEIKGGTSTPVLKPNKEVLLAKSGRTITATDKTASGGGYVLELGNGVELHSDRTLPRNNIVVMDHAIAVGAPDANDDRGLVVLISAEITNKTYDLDDEKLAFKDGVLAVTDGLKVGKRFGYPIIAGKNETDGLLVFSLGDGSGSDYGAAFILDSENLDLLNFIKGSADKILTDQNVYERFGPDDDLSRAILGVTSSGDISANVGSYLSSDQTSIKPNTLQILHKDLTDQFDFGVDEALSNIPTDGIFYTGSGDINGDGSADLVVVSNEECDVMIYLGDGASEAHEGYFSEENNLPCSEDKAVTSVAIGDLDSDGIDDIVFGFSDLNQIMAFFGTTELGTLPVLEDNAVIIGGVNGTQTIGEWLVIGDESTIHTGDGSGGTISFSLYESAFIQDLDGEDDGGSAAVGPGGFGCSLSAGPGAHGPVYDLVCLNLVLILLFSLRRKLKVVRNTQAQLKTHATKISSHSRFQSP